MNPNKRSSALLFLAWFLFLALPLGIALLHDVQTFSDDANRYASHIRSEIVSDWHSVLFVYEGIFIRRFLCLFLPEVKGTLVLRVWWVISWAAILVCPLIWLKKGFSVSKKYLFQAPLFFLGVLFLYLHKYLWFRYYLDLYFFAVVIVTLTATLFLSDRRGWVRNIAAILILLGLIHMPAFRRNAVLLMPLITLFAMVKLWPSMRLGSKLGISVAFSAAVYLLSAAFVSLLPVHSHQWPATPMVVSDLKNAAILENRLQREVDFLKTCHLEIYDRREHYGRDASHTLGPETFTVDICPPNEEEWKALVEHYLQAWKENSKAMVFSRLVQSVQFVNNGKVPTPIQAVVEHIFPDIKKQEMTWCWMPWGAKKQPQYGYVRWVTYTLVLLCLSFSWFQLRKKRGAKKEDEYMQGMTMLALTGVVYVLSFFVVVPTPDNRYHTLSLFLSFWYLSAFLLSLKREPAQNAPTSEKKYPFPSINNPA